MTDLRVGIVGAGGIAPPHIAAWLEIGAEISILDRRGAAALAAQHGLTLVPTLDELIDAVDVVDIISPTSTHTAIALAAIARGRDVVCEKPLALTAAEAADIVRAASEAGVRLFPAHVVRYFGDYARAKQEVDAGVIGDLVELTFRRTVAAPAVAWFYDQDSGGGIIRDLMIHDLDQAVWFAGPVARVSATQTPPADGSLVTPPVSAEVVLEHVSGAVSRVRADWAEPGTPFHSRAELFGTRGALRVDSAGDTGDAGYLPPASDTDPYLTQLADFVAARVEQRDTRVTPADGVLAVALVDAAYAALASGGAVPGPSAPSGP
ncbi:Gfo/Idh/MocA family oxidoreductase [Microbacterium istanbulense]|uniref:Gfo/Idh/MocA family oxidoreductase n=1 Tax=Microbacterium istanbulense TaxID=3122049 RepID=A0ABU8LN59_9MICO